MRAAVASGLLAACAAAAGKAAGAQATIVMRGLLLLIMLVLNSRMLDLFSRAMAAGREGSVVVINTTANFISSVRSLARRSTHRN
jgi:hypothetical protein